MQTKNLARLHKQLVAVALLGLPLTANAHSGVPAIIAYSMFGAAAAALCFVILAIYLLFSRYSWPQRWAMLGIFLGVAVAVCALALTPAGEALGVVFPYLVGLAPVVAVIAYQKSWLSQSLPAGR